MLTREIQDKITEIFINSIRGYFSEKFPDVTLPEDLDIEIRVIHDEGHGDVSSNIAMRLASIAKCSPMTLSEGIRDKLSENFNASDLKELVSKVESKKGFINLWLSEEYYIEILKGIVEERGEFGKSNIGKGKKINLEFVSANPTGPLTIAHGRQAAIGDTLSRILRFTGHSVTNEYYLNDFGRQIKLLGQSVEVRYRNLCGKEDEMPEDGYLGEYIIEIAQQIKDKKGDTLLEKSQKTDKFFTDYAVEYMMELIKKDLSDFGISFDMWTSQSKIEDNNEVEHVLKELEKEGHIFEDEGAKWFRTTKFGDDKDRVVVKSDGSYTYLAPDIAYHKDKYKRGFEKLIDLLGPDHHGYIKRMKAAAEALGHNANSLEILIVQLVTLLRGGQTVSMSTRRGEFISLREVLDEIGKDVTRFFFLMRKLDSHLDFDIELAKKESADNPVYYIQYAHARICSIKEFSKTKDVKLSLKNPDLSRLTAKEEKILIRKLSEFPNAVKGSALALEPNKLIAYLNELARNFHSFYTECKVVSDDEKLSCARFFLVEAVRIVLANGLELLNITLPEKM